SASLSSPPTTLPCNTKALIVGRPALEPWPGARACKALSPPCPVGAFARHVDAPAAALWGQNRPNPVRDAKLLHSHAVLRNWRPPAPPSIDGSDVRRNCDRATLQLRRGVRTVMVVTVKKEGHFMQM